MDLTKLKTFSLIMNIWKHNIQCYVLKERDKRE